MTPQEKAKWEWVGCAAALVLWCAIILLVVLGLGSGWFK